MAGLTVSFLVQGEGRGHMTQALALAAYLRSAGHELGPVLVGSSPWRSIPDYFLEGIQAEVETFQAPTLVPGPDGRALSMSRTLGDVVRRGPKFRKAVDRIHARTEQADVAVNFLDLLSGLSRYVHRPVVPSVAIAHNYYFLHTEARQPPDASIRQRLAIEYARTTASGAARTLALSFAPLSPTEVGSLSIVPPLLRQGLLELDVARGEYLLAYALNPGYGADLAAWSERSGVEVHCFVDGGRSALQGAHGTTPLPPSFHAHDLDDEAFMRRLAGCRAYVGSAGFESVCEGFALGKPILAVPTDGHVEQELNAWDAEQHGAARAGSWTDLDSFWGDARAPSSDAVEAFRSWIGQAPEIIVGAIERAAAAASHS